MIQENRPGDAIAFGFDEHEEYGDELLRVYKELKEKNPAMSSCLKFDCGT
jgi:hypothetical protein